MYTLLRTQHCAVSAASLAAKCTRILEAAAES